MTALPLLAERGFTSVISVHGAAPKFTLPRPPSFRLPFPLPSHLCVAVINSELLQRVLLMSRSQRPNRPQPPPRYRVSGQQDPASKNILPNSTYLRQIKAWQLSPPLLGFALEFSCWPQNGLLTAILCPVQAVVQRGTVTTPRKTTQAPTEECLHSTWANHTFQDPALSSMVGGQDSEFQMDKV